MSHQKRKRKKTNMSKSQNTICCRRIPPLTSELVSSMSLSWGPPLMI